MPNQKQPAKWWDHYKWWHWAMLMPGLVILAVIASRWYLAIMQQWGR